jgi:spore coat protein CotH
VKTWITGILMVSAAELALLTMTRCASPASEFPPLSVRLDVGSDHPSHDHAGHVYSADQEWTSETRVGYIGGYRVWSGPEHPVDGTLDAVLHENQRHNWEEYRFSDIPDGDYLVTMSFSEIGVPSYTVFDVAIEGQAVLESFRIYDYVGGNYALMRRFPVTVSDGELNVVSTPVAGEPRLAAIAVEARSPDHAAPATPVGLVTTSSYNAVLLDWADNLEDDLDGYHIYRARSLDGPYTRRTVEPVSVSRYADPVTPTHTTYYYCVKAVDVYGNASGLTSGQAGVALDRSDAVLPFYELEVPPENLRALYNHVFSDDEVDANFTYGGETFPVRVRYRGGYGRFVHKRSWKIKFPGASPFPGQDEINLRADYLDQTLMHTKLATDLFEAAGVQLPRAEHVLLALNGEYLGVYTYNEQVDEGFLERTGYDPGVSIYKSVHTDTHDWSRSQPSEQAYYEAYDKKTNTDTDYGDIIAFIELINNTPDSMFAYELGRVFDVVTYLDYYAVTVLISNGDYVHHNVYLLHDSRTDRWTLVPYDFDITFIQTERPINEGTSASPIQPPGWESVLLTRVLDIPQFRAYYCHRLGEFMDTLFSESAMNALIDDTYAAIEQDGLRDWQKYGREENEQFVASPDELKAYVAKRRSFLRDQMPAYCPTDLPYLKINEIMADNRTTPGQSPAWFEIYNAGLEPVDLSGMSLTDDLAAPGKFQIADGITVPASGFVTFFADGDLEQGPFHTSFRLDGAGGQVGIFSGTHQIDAYTFGQQAMGVSEGRHPDGVDRWRSFNLPTPGSSNLLPPPVIGDVTHIPSSPTLSDAVTVRTTITDDGTVLTATLGYRVAGGELFEVAMARGHGESYTAEIGPQPSRSLVEYRIVAWDDDGGTSAAPHDPLSGYYQYIVDYEPPCVFINEFMADNETTLSDEDEPDEFPDWIELYNPGHEAVALGGRYLTDDPANPIKFRIADGISIPAEGFLVFYADNDPDQGPLHTNFKLSKDGESVMLVDIDAAGHRLIDARAFGPQTADIAEGRYPDGDNPFTSCDLPTPGASNRLCDPAGWVISDVSQIPMSVSVSDNVTVTAVISDAGIVTTPTLWYSSGGGFVAIPMRREGDETYAATLPVQPEGTTVAYYVQIEDGEGVPVTEPPGAPGAARRYVVGYRSSSLFINEFMAYNTTTLLDPAQPGEFSDWIELYNAGPTSVDLSGKYLTDDLGDPRKFRIPIGLSIPAGGFALFYADNDPGQGPFHTNFGLNRDGESIGLFDSDANNNAPLDAVTFDAQIADVSLCRYPDGGETWGKSLTPSPGRAGVAAVYLPPVLK